MKKILYSIPLLCILLVWVGCEPSVDDPTSKSTDTTDPTEEPSVSPSDTTITTADTIRITWSGASAAIVGSHDSVTVSDNNGYVTVNSQVKDITYILSGNGQGQLSIYGTNRHQLILSDLTLACSNGPAINNQCKKSCFVLLQGTNSLTDGSSYASSDEDRKAAFFSEGQMIFSGSGSLTIKGNYKHALASDDYIQFAESTGTITLTASSDGIHANEGIWFDGGTIEVNAGKDGIQNDSAAIVINGGNIYVTAKEEGIESKGTITINGGIVYAQAADDAINSGEDFTITGGYVCAYSTGNDGMDANGNFYIKGGLVYAIGARSPEVAIDANTEERKQLYVQGGTIVAIGGLESGSSLTQSCYQASGSTSTWYALVVGSETFAFKTPNTNASTIVVSGASQPSLYKGVTASGTDIFKGIGYFPASYSGGSSVSLSAYSGSSGGGPGGGGPGGGGRPGGW